MGRRRRGPSPMQIEIMTCPMSGPNGLYFPYSMGGGGYSMDSFRPEYSGNRITEQDCRALLADINGCPMSAPGCDKGSWFFLVGFILMAVCMALFMVTATREMTANDRANSFGQIFGMGMGLIVGLGMVTLITNMCILIKRVQGKALARIRVINAILKKHNDSTFAGKQAIARLSTFSGYIAIQFLWVGQPMMMNPMAMGMPMMAASPPPMTYM